MQSSIESSGISFVLVDIEISGLVDVGIGLRLSN
jgi:hypothetical protein